MLQCTIGMVEFSILCCMFDSTFFFVVSWVFVTDLMLCVKSTCRNNYSAKKHLNNEMV